MDGRACRLQFMGHKESDTTESLHFLSFSLTSLTERTQLETSLVVQWVELFIFTAKGPRLNPRVRKIPWRRKWQRTPVFLPGKFHGWRNLVGYSPWGRKDSDTTERLHFHFSLSCIGEGNGNPLQYSCLENPMDRGAW